MAMNNPKPTPTPRNRKARRKSSPGQVAFLEYKAVRDKAKAEREAKQRQDAWYLHHFHPEIAKAKRAKGVKKNAENSAWRRQMFVESFADWPSVLPAEEMGYRIGQWLHDPSRSILNRFNGNRRWKWRGCEKHFVKTKASVRKKLTELKVFRYNFRARMWFKCGSVEEAEATQRLAEQEAERRRLIREEEDRDEAEKREAYWQAHRKQEQEANRKKAEANAEAERLKAEADAEAERRRLIREEEDRDRLSRPAVAGWHDFIPEELKATALSYIRLCRWNSEAQCLDDATAERVKFCLRNGQDWFVSLIRNYHEWDMRRVAEAVLDAD
jgi:hypothetical protein